MEQRFTIQFTCEQQGQLLREAIAAYGISKRALTSIKYDGGEITVNGSEQNVRYVLSEGDLVRIVFPIEQSSEGLIPEYAPLNIVYEDEAVLIINKPPYMNTIPSREHPTGSVANHVLGYYKQQNIQSTIHIVTRLDRDTSGLMCIAKHRHVHHLLSEMQQNGQLHRQYEALVQGHVGSTHVSIVQPIGRKNTSIIEREVREDGQFAHTKLSTLRHFQYDGQPMSHVRLKLLTGRTHQIRVHCAFIGHPLVGDELYGGSRLHLPHQALQCVSLAFYHPILHKEMAFTCELNEQMTKLMKR